MVLGRSMRLVFAVAAGLALAVGIDIARSGGLEAWLAARAPALQPAFELPPYEALGRPVDIDGRAVYLDCRGAGSPTVLLEAGFTGGADGWGRAFDGIAALTRVCAWDRPGNGRSESMGLHSGGDAVDVLRAALVEAREPGPYVVLAHSLGGVYARLLAAREPFVVGLVQIDTYEPDLGLDTDPSLPADVRAMIRASLDDGARLFHDGEELDWRATLDELAAAGPVRLPAIFLSPDPGSRYTEPEPARRQAILDAWYRAIDRIYPDGRLEVVPGAGHFIHLEQPDLVLDRVREVVERVRASAVPGGPRGTAGTRGTVSPPAAP